MAGFRSSRSGARSATHTPPRASGPAARLRLGWQVDAPPPADLKVSARLLAPDGALLAQADAVPVHDAYPTSRWRTGEMIEDSYDLPLAALPDGPMTVQVILYRPQDGSEVARWEQSGIVLDGGGVAP